MITSPKGLYLHKSNEFPACPLEASRVKKSNHLACDHLIEMSRIKVTFFGFFNKGFTMDVLWAPWRLNYILGPKPDECVFCIPTDTSEDEERCILARGEHCFVIMNKFPYNNGHLMVTPYRHVSNLTELTLDESNNCMLWLRRCTTVLDKAFNPQGINMGLNLGEAAGAGIAQHLHFQIVPRWNGDASFMAVFGETTVIPEHLNSTYGKLRPLFDEITA